MSKKIKAIRIDPMLKQVSVIELNASLEALQSQVEGLIDVGHRFPNGDVLYVNDEGLFNSEWIEQAAFFRIGEDGQPLVGPGIVVGSTSDDDTTDAKSLPQELGVQFAYRTTATTH